MEYCRAARRIRARWGNQTGKMHAELRELAARRELDAVQFRYRRIASEPVVSDSFKKPEKNDWSASAILGHRTPAARDFADLVSQKMIASLLTFSARRSLLKTAKARGINSFEANLIIAAVLDSRRQIAIPAAATPPPHAPSESRRLYPWLTAALVELAIFASIWHLFF
jgi:hypothetical protein